MNHCNTSPVRAADLRNEFIQTLSEEFLSVKGYGIYAFMSTVEVIGLFDEYQTRREPIREFARAYVQMF